MLAQMYLADVAGMAGMAETDWPTEEARQAGEVSNGLKWRVCHVLTFSQHIST